MVTNPATSGQRLIEHSDQGRAWIATGYSKLFFEWIEDMRSTAEKELRSASDLQGVFHAQGALDKLDRVVELKEKLLALEPESKRRR